MRLSKYSEAYIMECLLIDPDSSDPALKEKYKGLDKKLPYSTVDPGFIEDQIKDIEDFGDIMWLVISKNGEGYDKTEVYKGREVCKNMSYIETIKYFSDLKAKIIEAYYDVYIEYYEHLQRKSA